MILETERLRLRPWREDDAQSLFEYARDPDVGPIAGWQPHKSEQESREVIQTVLNGPQAYAVCLKKDDVAIGAIELMLYGRTSFAQSEDECMLGYWLGKPFWGKGLIPEAARELLRYAFEELGLQTVWCAYYDGNVKSKRVLEKLGFRYHHTAENMDVPLMGETRTGYVNYMTKELWEVRKAERE